MILAIFFILGLIVGSFLNVVVYRIHSEEKLVLGRSHCPRCRATISWYDNIPLLSFLLLRARCRKCQKKISWQYPLVEFFTGVLFLWVGIFFFNINDPTSIFPTVYYMAVMSFFVVILAYDALFMEIPGLVLWPAIGVAVLYNLIVDWQKINILGGALGVSTYSGTLAAFLAFMFFFLLVSYSKEKWMGMGDALLAIFLGLILGWPNILLALFLAFATGAIYGIILLVFKLKTLKAQVPFAPFLIVGSILSLFFYAPIVSWYINLVGF